MVVVEAVNETLEAVLDSHTRSQHCPYPTRQSARVVVVAAGKMGADGVAYQCSSKSWLIPPLVCILEFFINIGDKKSSTSEGRYQ